MKKMGWLRLVEAEDVHYLRRLTSSLAVGGGKHFVVDDFDNVLENDDDDKAASNTLRYFKDRS